MSLRNNFIDWYFNEFRLDELYLAMDMTTENSPWHHERTVGVHTDMVVAQYINAAPHTDWDPTTVVGALTCAFHDVGKPKAEVTKFSEERGEYRAYAGHEQISARLWEDWACSNWTFLQNWFGLTIDDIYRVGWLVENHLPWGLKKKDKLDNFVTTWGRNKYGLTLPHVLLADTRGRVADNHAEKIAASEQWVMNMINYGPDSLSDTIEPDIDQPHLIIPIGPSAAGKSTVYQSWYIDAESYSWDQLRLDWYVDGEECLLPIDDQYRLAFERSCEDREFNQKSQREFVDLVREKVDIYVDNTNLTKKRRNFFLQTARQHGYYAEAVLLPSAFDVVAKRQKLRLDKTVPPDAVKRQYMSLQLPWYGEFDRIRVFDTNIE